MKIKFTLARYDAPSVDLLATLDAGATVGDLAGHLARFDPALAAGAADATLSLLGSQQMTLDPERKIADSGLRSGATISVTRGAGIYPAAPDDPVTATIEVTAGPDAGRTFTVRGTSAVIGREPGCEIQLTDSMISRQHARLNIGRNPEIVDLGSANGIEINDSVVTRAPLRPGDVIHLGDTAVSIRFASAAAPGSDTGGEGFIRSPRLDPRYVGRTLTAPEPPQRAATPRFPIVALLGPMVMGGLLYALTGSVTSLVFVGLSPLMMIGYVVENQIAGRSAFRKAMETYRADVTALTDEARAAAAEEVAARNREHPSLDECVHAIWHSTPLLWTRRPTDPGFAELRIGLGRQPARNTIDLPHDRKLPRDLMAELHALAGEFAEVDGVPLVADAEANGAIGIAGPRAAVLDAARALLVQAAALHSPAELVIAAFASTQSAPAWEWLAWLPHITSAHSPLQPRHLASTIESATALITALEDLIAQRQERSGEALPAVLVLVEDDAAFERTRSRLVELAELGWAHGIHVLWLADDMTRLPAACRTYLSLAAVGGDNVAGFVHSGQSVTPIRVETLGAGDAMRISHRMSPMVDVGARLDDDSDLPRSVSLMHVAEAPLVPSAAVILERWWQNDSIRTGPWAVRDGKRSRKDAALAAVIGRTADGGHRIDLRADGPHALVGGTTGSGKSELLQTWILALAAGYSPQRLTFLLVDYKGGSAFKELKDLPHKVGFVTDLDPHEVERALVSLKAELRERERIFRTYGVKDLVELERRRDVEKIPPSLVIVVDEFAALVQELPDFVDGMINIAQRGRSLGVHLILATQRPAGVIKDNLRANTNLRIALRTADETDSTDVLGSPQAAFFDLRIPGRAVSKTGPGRLVPFQAGFAGGWTRDEPDPPEIVIEELRFGSRVVWELPDQEEAPVDPDESDARRLVRAMEQARIEAGMPLPASPWLDPLADVYNIADFTAVPNDRLDTKLVFGIQDLPETQQQLPVAFEPDTDGNLAVYGTGGSGKSTLLRTIAIAAGLATYGGPCHVYGLDFGARGLASLSELPHVGNIIVGTDQDLVTRLLTWLVTLVRDRADRFAKAGVNTIAQYRSASKGRPDEPRILLLVDGLSAFRQLYEAGRLYEMFSTIAADGRPVGVHVLLTADRPAAVPSALASVVQTRIVLRMADANEYHGMSMPADVIKPTSPPGRGMLNGVELQVAILGDNADARSQADKLEKLAASMKLAGLKPAYAIEGMPEQVTFDSLPYDVDDLPVFGLIAETLRPRSFVPEGAFLITGPPKSGRTATMRALALALRRWRPDAQLHFLTANRKSALASWSLWSTQAAGADALETRVKELVEEFRSERLRRPSAVFLENVVDLSGTAVDGLIKLCQDQDIFVVADGDPATLGSSTGLLGLVKASRYGIALAPDIQDLSVFRTQFTGRLNRADFPDGRGLFVSAGRTSVVQVGWAQES